MAGDTLNDLERKAIENISETEAAYQVTVVPAGASEVANGISTLFDASAAQTAEALKATAGIYYGMEVYNANLAAPIFFQFFNVAAASVNVGTTVPKMVVCVLPGAKVGFDFSSVGVPFTTAMSYACTSTATGSGAPGATISPTFFYK